MNIYYFEITNLKKCHPMRFEQGDQSGVFFPYLQPPQIDAHASTHPATGILQQANAYASPLVLGRYCQPYQDHHR